MGGVFYFGILIGDGGLDALGSDAIRFARLSSVVFWESESFGRIRFRESERSALRVVFGIIYTPLCPALIWRTLSIQFCAR